MDPAYNYSATPPIAHPLLRAIVITDEIKKRIAIKSKIKAKPTEIMDRLRDEHNKESPFFTNKDILN